MKKYLILMTAGVTIAIGSGISQSSGSACPDGECSACYRCAAESAGPVCVFTKTR